MIDLLYKSVVGVKQYIDEDGGFRWAFWNVKSRFQNFLWEEVLRPVDKVEAPRCWLPWLVRLLGPREFEVS